MMDSLVKQLSTLDAKKFEGLTDLVLGHLKEKQSLVNVYLLHGIRLHGKIVSFDSVSIFLVRGTEAQLVSRAAVSTIVLQKNESRPSQGKRDIGNVT
jgi:RNA chaperone Hfq